MRQAKGFREAHFAVCPLVTSNVRSAAEGAGARIIVTLPATSRIPPQTARPSRPGFMNRFANPGQFMRLSSVLLPWLSGAAVLTLTVGIIWGLFYAPADWQQGDTVRIMYVHVPMAWLASLGYFSLAVCGALSLIWRHPLADLAALEIGPVGAVATFICLATGSLWGEPMWGTWWVWDARLTSVLVLFFLYLGHIALIRAFDEPARGYRAAAILAIAGAVDLPIIKFSVQWWNTLHQPDSITLTGAPTMSMTMLAPLFICMAGFSLGFAAVVMARLRAALMETRARQLLSRRHADREAA
ncbi:heme exporter protein C [Tanticharoenia sakaeratensis NBRC 103193]|uniref:Heme exporter protein C n=2 Tax=Tanticharoenia TaxID=444052 RepID=A0A0D6MHR2_9PROT|nr:heme exporter protein C [Tanticharoenia sakaeratensis NBRC 103193]GBQ19697.1 heme exporter protein C [Tanticharoenia sakaeratensis NBRC 103193]